MKQDYWGLYWYLVVKKLFKQLDEYDGWEFVEKEDVRIRSDQSACEKIEAFIQAQEEESYVVSTPRT